MAVDYGAGASSAIAQQYADLRRVVASQGEAENRRKAEDIKRKGLFGPGITQENLQGLAGTGMAMAEFGDKRMAGQMDRATKSFERRRKESLGRIDELRRFGDPESIAEIKAIQAGMSENRSTYENLLGDYEGKGLFGTGFGSEGVGYKSTGDPSSYTKSLLESKKKREEEGERQAGILSDESRRQQGQISDYGSAPAKAEAPIYGGDLEGDIDQKYWAGGSEDDPRIPKPAAGVVEGLSREQQEEYEAAAFGSARNKWEEETARNNRRKRIEDEAKAEINAQAVKEANTGTFDPLRLGLQTKSTVPEKYKKFADVGKALSGSTTSGQGQSAFALPDKQPTYGGDLEGDSDQKYWAGGPEEDQPLGLAEKALADAAPAEAAPAPVPLTAHEKEGEERFFKGMSFKQRDKAMEGLKTYGGEYDDAFKQASGEKQKWFIWKGKPFSTALK